MYPNTPGARFDHAYYRDSPASGRQNAEPVPRTMPPMDDVRHYTISANGIRQHYRYAGSGPPVILLHGFPETGYAWRFQIPELARRYRVIAPDLRGYGDTDKPSTGYDKRTMANDIVRLAEALGIGRFVLVEARGLLRDW
jgi:hypothetical protein